MIFNISSFPLRLYNGHSKAVIKECKENRFADDGLRVNKQIQMLEEEEDE